MVACCAWRRVKNEHRGAHTSAHVRTQKRKIMLDITYTCTHNIIIVTYTLTHIGGNDMIHTLLVTMMTAAAIASAQPNANVDLLTYYTPDGGRVYVTSTDNATHDDDRIIGLDETAELYIMYDCNSSNYTLYSMEADGIHEIWMYGFNTVTVADDIAADWQVWDFPTIHNTYQN